jgi:hypothetical protein
MPSNVSNSQQRRPGAGNAGGVQAGELARHCRQSLGRGLAVLLGDIKR